MSKFNTTSVRARNGEGVLKSSGVAAVNHNGGTGYGRDEKSELFLLAVSSFVEDTFYESADNRTSRTAKLVKDVALADPEWLGEFIPWLRNEANLRSISLIVALEAAKALVEAGVPGGRALVTSAISRADEPGEALAYWISTHGRRVPSAVKRGIADAAVKTYSEYSLAKYDTDSKGFTFADVIRLTHPKPKDSVQADLFRYAIERRLDSDTKVPATLGKLIRRKEVLAMGATNKEELRNLLRSDSGQGVIQGAGLTWEAIAGSVGLDKEIWEALIPNMGYMALLRNLRNFIKEGVSGTVLDTVIARIADEKQVAGSRQLPFRFLSAYNANKDNLYYAYPLEKALGHSLSNVPTLKGKTLILVDRSGSMNWAQSKGTDLTFADSAAIFGTALALRAENATLIQYGTSHEEVKFSKGDSVLTILKRFKDMGGTDTARALQDNFDKSYDRVVLITDEQAAYGGSSMNAILKDVPMYIWNLVGYKYGHSDGSANRHTFGGLTDQSFKSIPLIEAGRDEAWPWIK